jgi:small subunit ribosomal protein S19
MAKEFTYRGKTLEELKKLDVREFAKYLPSRKRRSVLRQSEIIEAFIKNCKKKVEKNKKVRTHSRNVIIVPQLVGMTIYVYSGQDFAPVQIIAEMIGHYLGEFVLTRKKVEHSAPGIGATRSSASLSVK